MTVIRKRKQTVGESFFQLFMKKVDREMWKYGLGVDDLPDFDYRSAFEAGQNPITVARKARKNAGADF